ncbi:MAG: PAS domain-containing protein [Acidobacteria bacterium]|nr:PAS domain-containing protein [Acidobacteriota bacterium]
MRVYKAERLEPLRDAVWALLIGLTASSAMFVVLEMVERLGDGNASRQFVNLDQPVRGLIGALVGILAAAAYLFRRGLPSLEKSLAFSRSKRKAARHNKVEVRENLAAWIIGLRWIAVFGAAGVVGFATLASGRVVPEAAPYLWGGVLALAVFNGALSLHKLPPLASRRALALQVAGDVVALGWLLHFSGGLQNPFSGLFVFHAAIAAVALNARQARRVAAAIAGFVLAVAAVEATLLPPACLLGEGQYTCSTNVDWLLHAASAAAVSAAVVGCAFILSVLVETLRAERERLAQTFSALATRTEDLATAKNRAREDRERLQMILDCMADAVLYVTPDGVVRMHNRAARQFWPADNSEGDLRACHPAEKWDQLIRKVADPETVELHPVFQISGRSYEASYARVCDSAGTFRGVVMAARDVTERIEAQQWRARGEQLAVVGKLAAALAHELNNPLGAIALFTQHALAEIDPRDPLAEYLGTVMRNASLCKKIVRDLLEYARHRQPERRLVGLESILGDVVRTLEPHAQTSGVNIQCEVNTQPDIVIHGDPDQIRQILVNLGLNSIEAMPDGGLLVFRLHCLPSGSMQIAVVDTGAGVPPENYDRIFNAFYTTKPQGTGLGLAVARDLVVAHGGTIEFESTRGEGSTFVVTLPGQHRATLAEAG